MTDLVKFTRVIATLCGLNSALGLILHNIHEAVTFGIGAVFFFSMPYVWAFLISRRSNIQ